MGFIDGLVQGAYQWMTRTANASYTKTTHEYTNPADTEETNVQRTGYTTRVVCGTPLRKTKCLFVPEMKDFYTDNELNTVYHSASEYKNAVKKYGLIYKSQKFENADTAQKLLNYAKDWIKNNYHGGITSFNITALDMHTLGVDTDQYMMGQRVNVEYKDPVLGNDVSQTLTVISAEYDLYNPENNTFKIGIPDVALNKVYGETSKTGSGGTGGSKPSDQTDNDTNTEVDTLNTMQDISTRSLMEIFWTTLYKATKNGDSSYDWGTWTPPSQTDPTGDWVYALTPDILNSGSVKSILGEFSTSLSSAYIRSTGGVDADQMTANLSNFKDTLSETLKVAKDAFVGNPSTASALVTNTDAQMKVEKTAVIGEKTTTKDLEATNNATVSNKTTTKDLEATNNATVSNKTTTKDLEATNNATVSNKTTTKDMEATNKTKTKDLEVTNKLTSKDIVYVQGNQQQTQHQLQKCFDGIRIDESNGTITVYMQKADGSGEVSASFNMAATQFFQDAIAAAIAEGESHASHSIDVNTGGASYHSSLSLGNLAYMMGTTESNMHAIFNGTAVSPGLWYGFKVTCNNQNPRYYWFKT